jgi:hypothetical protein
MMKCTFAGSLVSVLALAHGAAALWIPVPPPSARGGLGAAALEDWLIAHDAGLPAAAGTHVHKHAHAVAPLSMAERFALGLPPPAKSYDMTYAREWYVTLSVTRRLLLTTRRCTRSLSLLTHGFDSLDSGRSRQRNRTHSRLGAKRVIPSLSISLLTTVAASSA